MAVEYAAADGVARITLARPPLNLIDLEMVDALLAALRRAGEEDAVRAVLIESASDRCFCAGLDLAAMQGWSRAAVRGLLDKLYIELLETQAAMGKPTVAAVSGAARGGGITLAISCDAAVADRDASFAYSEILLGLPPAIHFIHLPKLIGKHRAFDLLFTGEAFGAEQAQAAGIVARLAAPGAAQAEGLALARRFAAQPPRATGLGRAAFRAINDRALLQELPAVIETFVECFDSDECREGLAAFLERRAPNWPG